MMSRKGGQGWMALELSAFELGEQKASRSSDMAKLRMRDGNEWIIPRKVDGDPVFGSPRLREQTAPRS
jgi:hypothetical protein